MRAENDLIMPGTYEDAELIRQAVGGSGSVHLDLKVVKKCEVHPANIILQSTEYEGAVSYAAQSRNLRPVVECRVPAAAHEA